jgi:carbamoyltransferase
MYIIGINAFHADSSAALLKDGNVVWATEEERFTRIKHWAGLPLAAIDFCLSAEGISMTEISFLCVGRDPSAKQKQKIIYMLRNPIVAIKLLLQRLWNRKDLITLEKEIFKRFGFCPKIVFVEHHRAHLASSFYSSEFNEAAVISIDGSGDFSTVMIGKGINGKIEVLETQDFPVSIGIFYTAFTQFLGFPHYGDEYKVMGLSPYGSPIYLENFRKIMWLGKNNILEWDSKYFNLNAGVVHYVNNVPEVSTLYNKTLFEEIFGKSREKGASISERDKNLAASVQRYTEELIFGIVERAINMTGCENLCIAGGVAQNSVANGKIINKTNALQLYIPSAGHDAGISMGCAQYHYHCNLGYARVKPLYDANLGICFSNDEIKQKLDAKEIQYDFKTDSVLFRYLALEISLGKVVGFFDGQAEFGPRALGSRSILADPRNPEAQQLLNEKIKKRESFRPFAPSILEEFGSEYFEDYQFTPFMERVLKIREEKRELIPAVTHVDGSGRLQSVRRILRPRYHQLITEFYNITGIPILINTSFNENEPVVNMPEEAISTFERTNLDILVIGNYVLVK